MSMYEKQINELVLLFDWAHLKEDLQEVVKPFARLAESISVIESFQTVMALQNLLAAKDCAVRARVEFTKYLQRAAAEERED